MAAIAVVKTSNNIDPSIPLKTLSATVGVTHSFSPEGRNSQGVTRWVDRSGGIAIGFPAMTMQVRPPTPGSRVYKVTTKVVLPTLEQTSPSTATGIQPAPTKAYDCTCVLEFMLPERSTVNERVSLFNTVLSLLSTTVNASDDSPTDATGSPVKNAVANFEDVY